MNILNRLREFLRPRPLSCQQVNQFILDYLEGDMDEPTRVSFEAHMQNCPTCGSFLDQYRATTRLVRQADEITIPPAVIDRTIDFLRNRYDRSGE